MRTIWKYELKPDREQTITTPFASKLISAARQGDNIVVYAMVNPKEVITELHTVIVMGTGHEARFDLGEFLGTVDMSYPNIPLMFHVFEKWGRD